MTSEDYHLPLLPHWSKHNELNLLHNQIEGISDVQNTRWQGKSYCKLANNPWTDFLCTAEGCALPLRLNLKTLLRSSGSTTSTSSKYCIPSGEWSPWASMPVNPGGIEEMGFLKVTRSSPPDLFNAVKFTTSSTSEICFNPTGKIPVIWCCLSNGISQAGASERLITCICFPSKYTESVVWTWIKILIVILLTQCSFAICPWRCTRFKINILHTRRGWNRCPGLLWNRFWSHLVIVFWDGLFAVCDSFRSRSLFMHISSHQLLCKAQSSSHISIWTTLTQILTEGLSTEVATPASIASWAACQFFHARPLQFETNSTRGFELHSQAVPPQVI